MRGNAGTAAASTSTSAENAIPPIHGPRALGTHVHIRRTAMVGTAPAHLANDKLVHVLLNASVGNAWNVPLITSY